MSRADIFPVTSIDIRVTLFDWPFLHEYRREIDAFWRNLSADKPHVYDGRVLLLHQQEWQGTHFRGDAFETSYSAFMTWKRLGFPDARVTNFFGMAALRTQDDAFLLGEMGPHTANAGQSYFPAGTPEPADVRGAHVDLAASVTRECLEETGLALSELDLRDTWTAVITKGQIAFMRDLRLSMDAQSAKRKIEANLAQEDAPEFSRLHIVRAPEEAHGLTMPGFMQPFLDFSFR